jgi:carboxyl-terminal processing protease
MNKKVSLGVMISLIAVACAITFVLTMTVSLNMYNSMVAGIQERETINAKIKEIDTFVRSSSIYKPNENTLITGIANGYISGTSDKYAKYYTADEYYKLQQLQSGVIIGTGIETVVNGDYLEVTNVYEGSSAEVEEITKGCTITAVGGKSILEIGAEQARGDLRRIAHGQLLRRQIRGDDRRAQAQLDGEEGTKLSVTYSTPDGVEKTVTLVRQSIKLTSVKGTLIDGYAYIKIYTFNETTDERFIQLIDEYEAQSVLGYVFDVRDVSDGITEPVRAMLNRVLPKAQIAIQVDANGKDTSFIETDGNQSLSKPVTVLTNGNTACLAEIFAIGLRDFAKASVVGSSTAGKSQLQTTQSFKDGSAVSISTANIVPVESDDFENVGIKPDYTVDITAQQAEQIRFADKKSDVQLQKALEIVATE